MTRIFVLDDDLDVCQSVGDIVGAWGFDPCLSQSYADMVSRGAEVLACEHALLDINLGPGQPSGIEACRWLRDNGFARPIVLMTGHAADHPLVKQALTAGPGQLLRKPFGLGELRRILAAPV
jgi:FixJ family two-component response regulator